MADFPFAKFTSTQNRAPEKRAIWRCTRAGSYQNMRLCAPGRICWRPCSPRPAGAYLLFTNLFFYGSSRFKLPIRRIIIWASG